MKSLALLLKAITLKHKTAHRAGNTAEYAAFAQNFRLSAIKPYPKQILFLFSNEVKFVIGYCSIFHKKLRIKSI